MVVLIIYIRWPPTRVKTKRETNILVVVSQVYLFFNFIVLILGAALPGRVQEPWATSREIHSAQWGFSGTQLDSIVLHRSCVPPFWTLLGSHVLTIPKVKSLQKTDCCALTLLIPPGCVSSQPFSPTLPLLMLPALSWLLNSSPLLPFSLVTLVIILMQSALQLGPFSGPFALRFVLS